MFRDGGPFQYLILLHAIVFGVAPLVALIVAALRLRAPAAIWIGIGVLPLFIGALGTYQGAAMALDAVTYASSEMKDKMGAAGFSVALYTLVFGGLVSGALLSMFAAALGLGTAIGPGPDARISAASAPGALLLLASPLPAVFGLFPLVPMIALSAIGLVLVGLRFPSDLEGPDAPRVASARATVGVLGALAMFSGGTQSVSIAMSQAYHAMAMASPEMKDQMIAAAMNAVVPAVALPVVYGLLLLLAGGIAAALAGKHLLHVRTLVSAGLGALILSAGFVVMGLLGLQLTTLAEMATPFGETRTASLQSNDVVLPTHTEGLRGYGQNPTLQLGSSGVTLDDVPISPVQFEAPRDLNIEANGSTPLSAISPFFATAPVRRLHVAVDTPNGVRAAILHVMVNATPPPAPPEPSDFLLDEIPDRFEDPSEKNREEYGQVEGFPGAGRWWVRVVEATGGPSGAQGSPKRSDYYDALRSQATSHRMKAQIWFQPDDTVQHLVDAVAAVNVDRGRIDLYWRLDAPPAAAEAMPE